MMKGLLHPNSTHKPPEHNRHFQVADVGRSASSNPQNTANGLQLSRSFKRAYERLRFGKKLQQPTHSQKTRQNDRPAADLGPSTVNQSVYDSKAGAAHSSQHGTVIRHSSNPSNTPLTTHLAPVLPDPPYSSEPIPSATFASVVVRRTSVIRNTNRDSNLGTGTMTTTTNNMSDYISPDEDDGYGSLVELNDPKAEFKFDAAELQQHIGTGRNDEDEIVEDDDSHQWERIILHQQRDTNSRYPHARTPSLSHSHSMPTMTNRRPRVPVVHSIPEAIISPPTPPPPQPKPQRRSILFSSSRLFGSFRFSSHKSSLLPTKSSPQLRKTVSTILMPPSLDATPTAPTPTYMYQQLHQLPPPIPQHPIQLPHAHLLTMSPEASSEMYSTEQEGSMSLNHYSFQYPPSLSQHNHSYYSQHDGSSGCQGITSTSYQSRLSQISDSAYLQLPSELWFEIASYLSMNNVNALSLTSRPIRNAILPFLFQRIHFDPYLGPDDSLTEYFADLVEQLKFLVSSSISGSSLRSNNGSVNGSYSSLGHNGGTGIKMYVKECAIIPRPNRKTRKRRKGSGLAGVGYSLSDLGDERSDGGAAGSESAGVATAWSGTIVESGIGLIFSHLRAWPNLRILTLSNVLLNEARTTRLEELHLNSLNLVQCNEQPETDFLAFRVRVKNLTFDYPLGSEDISSAMLSAIAYPSSPASFDSNQQRHDSYASRIAFREATSRSQAPIPPSSQLPAPFLDSSSVHSLHFGLRSSKVTLIWLIKSRSPYRHLTSLSLPAPTFCHHQDVVVMALKQCHNVRHLKLHTEDMSKFGRSSGMGTTRMNVLNGSGIVMADLVPSNVLNKLESWEGPWHLAPLFSNDVMIPSSWSEDADSSGASVISASSEQSARFSDRLTHMHQQHPSQAQPVPAFPVYVSPRPKLKKVVLTAGDDVTLFIPPNSLVSSCLSLISSKIEDLEIKAMTHVGWTIMREIKDRFEGLKRLSLNYCDGPGGGEKGGSSAPTFGGVKGGTRSRGRTSARVQGSRGMAGISGMTNLRDLMMVVKGQPNPPMPSVIHCRPLLDDQVSPEYDDLNADDHMLASAPSNFFLGADDLLTDGFSAEPEPEPQFLHSPAPLASPPPIGFPPTLKVVELGIQINPDPEMYLAEKEVMREFVEAFARQCENAEEVRFGLGGGGNGQMEGSEVVEVVWWRNETGESGEAKAQTEVKGSEGRERGCSIKVNIKDLVEVFEEDNDNDWRSRELVGAAASRDENQSQEGGLSSW